MNANELMLGNYLQNKNIESAVQVGNINSDGTIKLDFGICKNVFSNTMTLFSFEGVPLTEKWLVEFGFDKNLDGFYRINKSSMIEICFHNSGILVTNQSVCLSNIKFVHQLQNLHFSLTGNHLQLVEPK